MNNDLFFSEKLRQQPSITTLIANSKKRKRKEAARRKEETGLIYCWAKTKLTNCIYICIAIVRLKQKMSAVPAATCPPCL